MNPTLLSRLRHLRLSGMAEALPGRLTQATAASLPHLEFLELLVEDELRRRADRLFTRRVKQAEITQIKEVKDFDWAFNPKIPRTKLAELASARFVALHEDVLLIGPPGVGKSHIATAIALGAIRAGYRVLVRSAFDLAQDFLEVFVRRHERGSTLVTTNRPTQDWGVFLGDIPAATAILDRFLSHAELVQMQGKSYRMHQRSLRQGARADAGA